MIISFTFLADIVSVYFDPCVTENGEVNGRMTSTCLPRAL